MATNASAFTASSTLNIRSMIHNRLRSRLRCPARKAAVVTILKLTAAAHKAPRDRITPRIVIGKLVGLYATVWSSRIEAARVSMSGRNATVPASSSRTNEVRARLKPKIAGLLTEPVSIVGLIIPRLWSSTIYLPVVDSSVVWIFGAKGAPTHINHHSRGYIARM
jgi:hypothetical protein